MAMAKFTVDTTAKLFIAKPTTSTFDVRVDLLSDAKEHWIDDAIANGHTFPLISLGGFPIEAPTKYAPAYIYLTNGWRIRPREASHTLNVTGGVLLVDGGGDPFVDTLAAYFVRVLYEQPVQAIAVNQGAVISPTPTQVAEAVWDALTSGFLVPGSFGELLNLGLSPAQIAMVLDIWRRHGLDPDPANQLVSDRAAGTINAGPGLSQSISTVGDVDTITRAP